VGVIAGSGNRGRMRYSSRGISAVGAKAMSEQPPLVRQWLLLRTLCARRCGVSIEELAGELSVSTKTIRRDLGVFQEAGFPLEETVEQFGRKRWRIDPAKSQPGLSFAFDEAVALYLARRLMEPLAGTPFWEAAQRAFRKIRATLGSKALRYVERFAELFHETMVGVSDYSKKAELVDQLLLGIEDRRAVFITYRSLQSTEPITYDVFPYGIVHHRGSLYLVGWSPDHQEIRHWKLDRMEDAEVTEVRFERPEGFDLPGHLAKSFGVFHGQGNVHVKIHFSAEVARYVQEKTWHPSQKLKPQKDGSLLAEFDLDGTEEIKRWILSFGRHAEVLEPGELREQTRQELHALVGKYEAALSPRASQRRSIINEE
jgi:predicted DNA-binding transcriptional regulator YafY